MLLIDKLSYQSKLRYVNSSEKVLYAVLTLIICITSRSIAVAAVAFLINGILTVGKGGISLSHYLKLLLIPFTFLVVGTAAIMLNISAEPFNAFAVPVGRWYLTVSREGAYHAFRLCATALSAVSCLYFLSLNTVMTDILGSFRKLHIPDLIIELMMLIYRFIFVLFDQASSILISSNSRLGNKNFRTSVRSFGKMGAALFILSVKRSSVLYDALESRCYDGRLIVLSREKPVKKSEVIMILVYDLILILVWMCC